ncbi:hypothetical protein COEX109129_24155 [Corallococcus exiguus]
MSSSSVCGTRLPSCSVATSTRTRPTPAAKVIVFTSVVCPSTLLRPSTLTQLENEPAGTLQAKPTCTSW